jgi:hypothetical protein
MEKEICFIVGAPRSGTTWLNTVLLENPNVCGGEESYFFYMFAEFKRSQTLSDSSKPVGPYCYFNEDEFAQKIKAFWYIFFEELYAQNPDSKIHVEKTPFHALFLDAISLVFPNSKVIFLKRDSRAVVSSILAASQSWGTHWAPRTPKEASIMWHQHARAVLKWRKGHPEHVYMEVKYEDLIEPDSPTLREVQKFALGSSYSSPTSKDISTQSAVTPKGPKGFARLRGADGWTTDMNFWQKLVIWRYTRKLMKEIGYDITPFT